MASMHGLRLHNVLYFVASVHGIPINGASVKVYTGIHNNTCIWVHVQVTIIVKVSIGL